jgi:hypothetical protein
VFASLPEQRRAFLLVKLYFKNEKKPICIQIFINGLKYINIFLILYTKYARKFVYVLQCAANQKSFGNHWVRALPLPEPARQKNDVHEKSAIPRPHITGLYLTRMEQRQPFETSVFPSFGSN